MTSNHELSGLLLSKMNTQASIKSVEYFVKNVYITISK